MLWITIGFWYVSVKNGASCTANAGTSPVRYSVGYYEKDGLENQYERNLRIRDGAWVTSSLKKRQRTVDGRVLRYGRFLWEFINPAGGR